MVPVKYLVVGIAGQLQIIINKALVYAYVYRCPLYLRLIFVFGVFSQVFKNGIEPFYLFFILCKYQVSIFLLCILVQILNEQIEIFIERRLRLCMKLNFL